MGISDTDCNEVASRSPRDYLVDMLNFSGLVSNDAIWWHRSASTLTQVMDCCPIAPSHYPNQCWLIISRVLRPSSQSNSTVSAQLILLHNAFKNCIFQITATSPRGQWVNLRMSLISNHWFHGVCLGLPVLRENDMYILIPACYTSICAIHMYST